MKDPVKGLWRETKISKTGLYLNRRLELQHLIFIELFSNLVHPRKRVHVEQSLAERQPLGPFFGFFVWVLLFISSVI